MRVIVEHERPEEMWNGGEGVQTIGFTPSVGLDFLCSLDIVGVSSLATF